MVFEYGHCTIAEWTTDLRIVREVSSYIPKKQRSGGQSAPRFGRLRLETQHRFDKKIKEYLSTLTYDTLYVGGPGLSQSIWERKNIGHADHVVGCQYNGISGVREVLYKIEKLK